MSSQLPAFPQQIVFLAGIMMYLYSYIPGITAETTLYMRKRSRHYFAASHGYFTIIRN